MLKMRIFITLSGLFSSLLIVYGQSEKELYEAGIRQLGNLYETKDVTYLDSVVLAFDKVIQKSTFSDMYAYSILKTADAHRSYGDSDEARRYYRKALSLNRLYREKELITYKESYNLIKRWAIDGLIDINIRRSEYSKALRRLNKRKKYAFSGASCELFWIDETQSDLFRRLRCYVGLKKYENAYQLLTGKTILVADDIAAIDKYWQMYYTSGYIPLGIYTEILKGQFGRNRIELELDRATTNVKIEYYDLNTNKFKEVTSEKILELNPNHFFQVRTTMFDQVVQILDSSKFADDAPGSPTEFIAQELFSANSLKEAEDLFRAILRRSTLVRQLLD